MADIIKQFTDTLNESLGNTKRVKKGDIRKWNPTRTNDSKVTTKDNQQKSVVDIANNRNFNLNDYVWYNSSAQFPFANSGGNSSTDGIRNLRDIEVPKIILKEFQPDFLFNWGDLVDEALGGISKLIGGIEGGTSSTSTGAGKNVASGFKEKTARIFGGGFNALGKVAASGLLTTSIKAAGRVQSTKHLNDLLVNISNNHTTFNRSILDTPVELIRRMFSGEFLSTYELPYYGDVYLSASSSSNWSRSGLAEQIGSTIGTFLKQNLSLDVPTTPTWKNEDGGGAPPAIEVELILYNKDIDSLIKNYRFINSLISGAYWTQINYNQKSPNLYDVTIPGRLHHFYCTMDINLEYMGKTRALSAGAANKFENSFGSTGDAIVKNNIKTSDDYMYPDGYMIKITLNSLMPNNFNMYLDYIIKGSTEKGQIDRKTFGDIVGETSTQVKNQIVGQKLSPQVK